VALGFLFKSEAIDWHTALFIAGVAVTCVSFASFLITFRQEVERDAAAGEPAFDSYGSAKLTPTT
jgi:hypothetical protein